MSNDNEFQRTDAATGNERRPTVGLDSGLYFIVSFSNTVYTL